MKKIFCLKRVWDLRCCKLFLCLLLFILMISVSGCSEKPSIIFNKQPITKENVFNFSSVFIPGSRIYYLIIMPEIQNSRMLNIQIIKKGDAEYLGYSLYMSRRIRLKDEETKYYTDYFVLNERGAYIMKVYSADKPKTPLTQAEFYIK